QCASPSSRVPIAASGSRSMGCFSHSGVSPRSDDPIVISAGSTSQLPLVGWSSEPVDAWKVRAATEPYVTTGIVPSATIDPDHFNNATAGSLRITVPGETPAGNKGRCVHLQVA